MFIVYFSFYINYSFYLVKLSLESLTILFNRVLYFYMCYLILSFMILYPSRMVSRDVFTLSMAPDTFLAVSASQLTAIGSLPSILASSVYHYVLLFFFPFSSDKCTSIRVICDWNRFSFSAIKDVK
jgi:hypothetical protein